jgi:uncharacterized protein (TIGR03437 family)
MVALALPGLVSLRGEAGLPQVGSIVNSASYAVAGQNGSGIAQGSIFTLFGQNLGPERLVQAGTFPLTTRLGDTSIRISSGRTSWEAIMIYSSAQQVAAILPSDVPIGDGQVTLTYSGRTAAPAPIKIVSSAFGIYSVTANGVGAGVVTTADYRVKTFSDAAGPGDVLVIWGTGLGPVGENESLAPVAGNRFPGTEVFVGNRPAPVLYAGRSGCCAGTDQIVFQVPSTVSGCFVPVAVRSGGTVSNFVTIPIAPEGRTCSDPVGVPSSLIAKAQSGQPIKVGVIGIGPIPLLQGAGFSFARSLAGRFSELLQANVSERDILSFTHARGLQRQRMLRGLMQSYGPALAARHVSTRQVVQMANSLGNAGAAAGFTQLENVGSVVAQFGSVLPPAGACTVIRDWPFDPGVWGASSQPLDAGSQLFLSGPIGTRALTGSSAGESARQYQVNLGSGFANTRLPAGKYSLSGKGGREVGAFTATLAGGATLEWTNKAASGAVDRSQSLVVNWSADNLNGWVVFGGGSSVSDLRSGFVCTEEAGKQTLTVPAYVLGAMPRSPADRGYLFLARHPLQNPFYAPGIDIGYFVDFSSDSKELAFQ